MASALGPEGLDSFFAFQPSMPLIRSTCLVMGGASALLCGIGAVGGGVDHTRRKVEPAIVRFHVDPHCGAEGIEHQLDFFNHSSPFFLPPPTPICS